MDVGDDKRAHVNSLSCFGFFCIWEAEAMRLPCAIQRLEPGRGTAFDNTKSSRCARSVCSFLRA
jgi:hypothetical protein